MPGKPNIDSEAQPSNWLLQQWIIAGIVSASTRFIPIPFVDEFVQAHSRRFTVATTLNAHDSAIEPKDLEPYFGIARGCLPGCGGMLVKAPLKLLIFPFRKIFALITSIRDAPLEIVRMVLLGRTLDRYIRAGKLVETAKGTTVDFARATRLRAAFDQAFAGIDLHFIRAVMKDALTGISTLKTAALVSIRHLRGSEPVENVKTETKVQEEAERVQGVLDRPDVLALFAEFDQRFDEAMKRLT